MASSSTSSPSSASTSPIVEGPSARNADSTAPPRPANVTSVDALTNQLAGHLLQYPDGSGYVSCSSSILVSLRPDPPPASVKPYVDAYYRLSEGSLVGGDSKDDSTDDLQPHVYELALRAYAYMRRTGQDQGMLLHSAATTSATGQGEQRRLATRALLTVSSSSSTSGDSSSSKSARVAAQIQAADFILDAFGSTGGSGPASGGPTTAHTPLCFASPRFARYSELQFSERGRIAGYKCITYGLDTDTGRIAFGLHEGVNGIHNRDRSFAALRWLLAGASPDERAHLRLPEPSSLQTSSPEYLYDRERFGLLKQAFKAFGFPKKAVASVCSTLAAILHISSLEFAPSSSGDLDEGCTVSSSETLHNVALLLGLLDNPSAAAANLTKLGEAFTSKTAYVDGERCTIVLDVEKASDYKEDVAKTLYRLLWGWIGEFINQKLERDDFANFISLVDFPALANSPGHRNEGNTLSTLCNNLASERIFSFLTSSLVPRAAFEVQESQELMPNLILKPLSPPASVSETIRVLTNQPGGLVHIIDDQSVRKGKTEKTMLEAMGKRWGKNRQFGWRKESADSASSRAGTFTVEHWNDGELVTYSTESFLEKNVALVPADLVELLGGKAVPTLKTGAARSARRQSAADARESGKSTNVIGGSANPFVRELFSAEVAAAAADEKITMTPNITTMPDSNDGSAPAMGQGRKGSVRRRPSTRRKPGAADENAQASSGTPGVPTLARKGTVAARRAELMAQRCVLGNLKSSLDDLFDTLQESCRLWFVICLTPYSPNSVDRSAVRASGLGIDTRYLKSQIKAIQLHTIRDRCSSAPQWVMDMDFRAFWDRYSVAERWQTDLVKRAAALMWKDKMAAVKEEMDWTDLEFAIGRERVFLTHSAFMQLEDCLRAADQDEQKKKREWHARSGQPESDPYNPWSRPSLPLAAPDTPTLDQSSPFGAAARPYNHPLYANSVSTAALPLVGGDPFADDIDKKTFATDDDFAGSSRDIEEGGVARGKRETGDFLSTYELGNVTSPGGTGGGDEKTALTKSGVQMDDAAKETVEVFKESRARKQWKFIVWMFTWWIPSPLLKTVGRMKRSDVRMAWREKVTIFMLIMMLCGVAVFVVAILGNLICPKEYVYATSELSQHGFSNNAGNELVAIRGEVFDLTSFANIHYPSVVPVRSVLRYGGVDASDIFPVQVSALCNGIDGSVSPWVTLDTSNTTDENAVYHDFRAFTNDSRPDWYWEQMVFLRYNYRKGFMGYTKGDVSKRAKTTTSRNTVIYRGNVYDMTGYIANNGGGIHVPAGTSAPADTDRQFMHDQIVSIFQQFAGQDVTNRLDGLNIGSDVLAAQRVCLRNLFFIGKVDSRNSVQCQFSRYILLAFSIIMVAIVGFKFIAALQFGKPRQPENHDRFVVLQVPCYTEGEESLKECFESLASLKYDDKRKLLFVICDGMIVGSGNDRPTPRIVLDILGADPALDPEPLSFQSLGEGSRQHNMGKVYSGLYEHAGHVIPYIVFVKVGKPSERSKPGNRGKRDSQMVLMRFFNRVHFDSPMSPCELEVYHQIKNVIGVNPTFYEFLLAIDADTVVDPFSLNRFISVMTHDRKVIATCGETELANAKKSMISMIQVYEYFISHHLAKAFESLFGSVTCLPGCFSLYRLRSMENKPVFIANDVVMAFGENRVDTLHMKNLLHLGEDRYLTTLLLKNFPSFKLTFTKDAHAKTIAPEEWKVLLSQRRRWINSTIHNLAELIGRVDRLCGFCCCSMRSIVLIDLLSTLIQPVTVAYIGYIVYLGVGQKQAIPLTAIIMLAAIYGLQALIFLLHRKFDMIVWMIIYILAIPVFSFLLPLYAFWKQDDFSWGQTRIVLGEKGKKLVIHDEGEFDEKQIPLKSWHDYENELWERGSNASIGQILAEKEEAAYAAQMRGEGSIYGHESVMGLNNNNNPYQQGSSRPRTPMSELGGGTRRSYHQALNSYPSGGMSGGASQHHTPHHSMSMNMQGYTTPGGGGYAHSASGSQIGISPYASGGYHLPHSSSQYSSGQGFLAGQQGENPFASFSGSSPASRHQSRQSFGGQSGVMMQSNSGNFDPSHSIFGGGAVGTAPSFSADGKPSDEQLESDIRAILARADLQTLTKKGVREELERAYGMDLTDRKAFINSQIEQALSNLY